MCQSTCTCKYCTLCQGHMNETLCKHSMLLLMNWLSMCMYIMYIVHAHYTSCTCTLYMYMYMHVHVQCHVQCTCMHIIRIHVHVHVYYACSRTVSCMYLYNVHVLRVAVRGNDMVHFRLLWQLVRGDFLALK